VRVEADPLELSVEPGGPPASTTVSVFNKGSLVDDFHVAVNGPVAAFAQVHPPVLHVFPGEHQTAQVRFAVPRAPQPAAGRYAFQVVARAHVHADVVGQVVGGLTVGRFDEMTATIEPEMTRGRAPGHHRLTVVNGGNGPLDVRVALADQQGELTFTPTRFGGLLAPGATATEPVVVAAPLKWFGRTQVHPFSGTVSTDVRGQAAVVQARRRQVPRFPWWVPTTLLALVGLAIALYAVIPKATVPKVAGLDRVAATAALQKAGLRVVEIEKSDDAIPVGQAIETKPAADSRYKRNDVAQLFISQGKCGDACPAKIPVVDGLAVEEAKGALVAAGFVVDRVNPVPDPRPPGTVVATNPAGGQEVAAHEKVIINAAIGPAAATSAPAAASAASAGVPVPANPGAPTAAGPPPIPASLVGGSGADAVKALTALGLKVTQVHTHSNARALDEVLSITPPPGAPVAPGSPVTVELAAPTAVDLVKAAPTAVWTDELGAIVFAPPPAAPAVPAAPARGAAFLLPPTTPLEDNTPAAALAMQPGPNGRVTGAFTLPQPVIAGDHVRALVGVLPGATGTVEFSATANGILLTPTITDTSADGALKLLDVDLGAVVGATALQVSVKPAVPASADNRAFLKDLRIEGLIG
jgi:beta-lactam-binding protein with PASTA domain